MAQFPGQVWDGLSPTRPRKDQVGSADVEDFETMRAELQATQTKVLDQADEILALQEAPSGAFEYTPITADTTLVDGQRYSNSGASGEVIGTLDADAPVDATIEVFVMAAHPFRVKAPTGVTITTLDGTTASAGYFRSNRPLSRLTLTKTSSTTWIADASGTWAKDSTTSAGYAYTPSSWTAWTPTSADWTANVTFTGDYRQVGDTIEARINVALTGTPSNAGLTTNNWPGGLAPSTTKNALGTRFRRIFAGSATDESAGGSSSGICQITASIYVPESAIYFNVHGSTNDPVNQNTPWAWANQDMLSVAGSYRVD